MASQTSDGLADWGGGLSYPVESAVVGDNEMEGGFGAGPSASMEDWSIATSSGQIDASLTVS